MRKAGEPADESHRYGHEKIENLAAAIEGILILVGSAVIAFEAIRHLVGHGRVQTVGLGIAVVALRWWSTSCVSHGCGARPHGPVRRRSRATPPTSAPTR